MLRSWSASWQKALKEMESTSTEPPNDAPRCERGAAGDVSIRSGRCGIL